MKKLIYWIVGLLIGLFGFIAGALIRQPQINKLKEQVKLLQKDNRRLLALVNGQQQEYQKLLVEHKALKALQFRKKAKSKERLEENLTMQYAIRAYLVLLLKSGRHGQKMEKAEVVFFNAFEKVINGKKLSTSDKVKIRDYIMEHHKADIKALRECEIAPVLQELNDAPEVPKVIYCQVRLGRKKTQYYITDDETVVAGSIVYVLGKKNSMNAVEVVSVEKYAEDDVPEPIEKTPRIIRKCHEDELLLPEGKK